MVKLNLFFKITAKAGKRRKIFGEKHNGGS